jgi:fimbrial chaperone protein
MRLIRPLAAALALACACAAFAGEFSVTPVRMEFAGVARSQLLSITNTGNAPARFLARGAAWTMNENGGVELADDDGLIVFPASFTLAPKATQNVRVGTSQRPGDTEKTWRVVLEELPDPAANPGAVGASIAVLSMISVPVFMPPLAARKALDVSLAGVSGNTAQVALNNQGNAHELVAGVSITALRGEAVAQQAQQEGWYVLPGKRRVYGFNASGPWCAPGVTALELKASDLQGQVLARKSVDAREVCR